MSVTGLHIRRRLRRRLVGLLDLVITAVDPPDVASAARQASPDPAPPSPPPTPPPPVPPTPRAESAPLRPLPAPKKETPADGADRQARHWARTRLGLLRFIHEKGGTASLRELHEHSESTYFVAHVSFSRMMEELTGGGLLDYDHDTAVASLTDTGRAEL